MKRSTRHIIYLILLLFIPRYTLFAQQAQVAARIDSTSILIGDQTTLRLTVAYDAKNGVPKIQWPQIGDTIISKVDVISKSKIRTILPDSAQPTIQQQVEDIVISSFDSGYYAIPPFKFIINGDTANPQLTEAMMLQVNTVHVDTTKAYKDIKGPIQAPFTILEILPYIGYGLLALLVIGAIIYYVRKNLKKKNAVVVEQPKVIVPPHVKALEELEKLASKNLWQEGKIKDYYTGITDILRTYLVERYDINALEMTTDEIMLSLRRRGISDTIKQKLNEVLVLADLVKFAKENPLPSDHEFCYHTSVAFITETAETPMPAQPAATAPTSTIPNPQPQ